MRQPRPVLAVLSALLAASSFAAMAFVLVVPYGLIFAIVPLLPVTVLFAIDAFCLARGSRSAGLLAIIALCMVAVFGGYMLWK